MPQNIVLKGIPIRKEREAEAAITPGMLVEMTATGTVQAHGDAGEDASPTFAVEQDFLGGAIDDAYAEGDQVQYVYARPGDEILAWLSGNEDVAIGDLLESDGAGALQAFTAQDVDEDGNAAYTIYTRAVVGRAIEALDLTGVAAARIRIEVV